MAEKISRKKRNSEMRGQKCKRVKEKLGRYWLGSLRRGLVREIRVLTEEHIRRGLGPAGEATYESGARKFPAQLHEELISLIYTRPGPMSHPQGPCTSGESKSESPPLTPASLRYKTEVFHPDGRKKSARTSSPTLPPKHTHKIEDYSVVNYRK